MEEKNCGETPQARPAARRSSHGCVELDECAVELILREGFSEAYGARNLERVMDRMLGTLIAVVLLTDKLEAGQVIQVVSEGNEVKLEIAKDLER